MKNCLPGSPFYLGIDNNHGPLIDFPAVLLHEMGHGLGFQTFTSGSTGNQLAGFPAIWDHYMLDNRTGKLWTEMTAAERIASANAVNALVWTGANVTAAVSWRVVQGGGDWRERPGKPVLLLVNTALAKHRSVPRSPKPL